MTGEQDFGIKGSENEQYQVTFEPLPTTITLNSKLPVGHVTLVC